MARHLLLRLARPSTRASPAAHTSRLALPVHAVVTHLRAAGILFGTAVKKKRPVFEDLKWSDRLESPYVVSAVCSKLRRVDTNTAPTGRLRRTLMACATRHARGFRQLGA